MQISTNNMLSGFFPDDQIDFHDFDNLIPYDIEKILNEFIEDSIVSGFEKILIITGKGKVVRPTVERLLKKHKSVSEFRQAGYHDGGEGAFRVWLR